MDTAKLFMNGSSQAVRLPKEYRFDGNDVYIQKIGNLVILLPKNMTWDEWWNQMQIAPHDFMENRNQPESQERESF